MLLTVDVLGLNGDVFVVDDLKVGVLEVVHKCGDHNKYMSFKGMVFETKFVLN